ncbi:nucleoside hydrolase [Micrococcales bacterium 31B]|nr:nucleoside hydrolase [Micrococcales bacterium 31B]
MSYQAAVTPYAPETPSEPVPVILDVDTGIDDAMAIMFAVRHPLVDVQAITCVAGNASVDQVVRNTQQILDLIGAPEIPVAAGALRPLVEVPRHASWVHGETGLGTVDLPPTQRTPEPVHAVELLRRTLAATDRPITLVTLAPMTNLALFVRTYPDLLERIERIVFMGGSASIGNATAVAEFNVWHDPEAAHIVLSSGVPLTMYGLDVFNRVVVPAERRAALKASADPIEHTLGALLGHVAVDPDSGHSFEYQVIGDAGAVCALVAPDLFTFEVWPVQVDISQGLARGATVVDRRPYDGGEGGERDSEWRPSAIALQVQVPAVLDLFFDTVTGPAANR